MSNSIPVKWLAVPATQIWPHEWPAAGFQYTSIDAPVEADEYERQVKRAEAAEARTMSADERAADDLATIERLTLRVRELEARFGGVERYGADQWRRGNAGKDPQEFEEWRKEAQP